MSWITSKQKNPLTSSATVKKLVEVTHKNRPPAQLIFNLGEKDLDSVIYTIKQQNWNNDELLFIIKSELQKNNSWIDKLKKNIPTVKSFQIVSQENKLNFKHKLPIIWINYQDPDINFLKNNREKNHLVISEDSIHLKSELRDLSDEITPTTSMAYNLNKLLGGE